MDIHPNTFEIGVGDADKSLLGIEGEVVRLAGEGRGHHTADAEPIHEPLPSYRCLQILVAARRRVRP